MKKIALGALSQDGKYQNDIIYHKKTPQWDVFFNVRFVSVFDVEFLPVHTNVYCIR